MRRSIRRYREAAANCGQVRRFLTSQWSRSQQICTRTRGMAFPSSVCRSHPSVACLLRCVVLRLEASPTHVAALDATLDLVQVGDQNDAAVLTIVTRKASSPAVVELLVSLRMRLLQLFGGRRIDFNLIASARGNGEFVLVFAPVAAMAFDPTMKAYFNPATGEVYDESQLPCATVDSSQGKGNILTYTPQAHALAMLGEHVVRRLFDFNRQPGARAAMVDFIADRYGVILRGSNGRTEHVGIPLELKLEPPPPLFERSKMASG